MCKNVLRKRCLDHQDLTASRNAPTHFRNRNRLKHWWKSFEKNGVAVSRALWKLVSELGYICPSWMPTRVLIESGLVRSSMFDGLFMLKLLSISYTEAWTQELLQKWMLPCHMFDESLSNGYLVAHESWYNLYLAMGSKQWSELQFYQHFVLLD